jgi:hypothetical protein
MLDLYRRLGVARRNFALPSGLDADIVELGDGLVGLRRGSLLVVMNVTDAPIDVAVGNDELMASASVIVATTPDPDGRADRTPTTVAADSTTWFALA